MSIKLGPWTVWADKSPQKPGLYWLAGYIPVDADCNGSTEPEDPVVWPISDREISGEHPIRQVHGWEPENLIWCGPITAPGFTATAKAKRK